MLTRSYVGMKWKNNKNQNRLLTGPGKREKKVIIITDPKRLKSANYLDEMSCLSLK